MKDMMIIIATIEKIVEAGRKAYNKHKKDKTKKFRLSLEDYPTGNLVGRHLVALGYTLSFTPKYASWKGLIELPYYNRNKLTVIDCGIPDTLAVNLVITQVAKEICGIEVNDAYYLTKDDIKTAYKIAKSEAEDEADNYSKYSGTYADATFEIEADA